MRISHEECGPYNADGEPEFCDCPCRTTREQKACGDAGCGFCRISTLVEEAEETEDENSN